VRLLNNCHCFELESRSNYLGMHTQMEFPNLGYASQLVKVKGRVNYFLEQTVTFFILSFDFFDFFFPS
jgi:hypothetical protein